MYFGVMTSEGKECWKLDGAMTLLFISDVFGHLSFDWVKSTRYRETKSGLWVAGKDWLSGKFSTEAAK
jgi:hypothetical protein